MRVAPDDATTPTWAHTKLGVTEASVGVGIRYPQRGAKLHVLLDVRIDGGLSANHHVLAPWVQITTHTKWAITVQQQHPQYLLIVERTNPDTDNLRAESIRLVGPVSPVLAWRVEQRTVANTPIDLSDGAPYVAGPTLGGMTDRLTARWGVTVGVCRTHIFSQTLPRHNTSAQLTETRCHGMYTDNGAASFRVRVQIITAVSVQCKATM